ncbi:MAG: OmpA family protein, partial [Verrucomicrobia bacterium]|nr:OmpA family protein [Cytophagales bacterium]
MPGGKGGTDLYVCSYENGIFSSPQNLSNLNTEGNEMFPFIDEKNNLYFASDGWAGLGGLDIFFAKNQDSTFQNPVNVGFPINSVADDFGLITDADRKSGFFSSNRRRSVHDDDIYRFVYAPAYLETEGLVMAVADKKPLAEASVMLKTTESSEEEGEKITLENGKFDFKNLKPDTDYQIVTKKNGFSSQITRFSTKGITRGRIALKVYLDKQLYFALNGTVTNRNTQEAVVKDTLQLTDIETQETVEAVSDENGRFHFELKPEKRYQVNGVKNGIRTNTEKISTKGRKQSETLVVHLHMGKANDCDEVKRKYFVENMYYDLDKYNIRPDAQATLDKVVRLMKENAAMKIDISSHTDARGAANYNAILSNRRSQSVVEYLSKKGIAANRMSMRSHGEAELLNACADNMHCPEEEQQRNRRTEFQVFIGNNNISEYRCKEDDPLRENGFIVRGKIMEGGSKIALSGAKVVLTDQKQTYETLTGADGLYAFSL